MKFFFCKLKITHLTELKISQISLTLKEYNFLKQQAMITGEIKNRIDTIWDAFWTGGITNSITILEQMTYLFFMKMLDDAQRTKEANANAFGVAVKDPTFPSGSWHNPDSDRDVPYQNLRWSVFKNMDPETMYRTVSRDAFVFIKTLGGGRESAYSRFKNADAWQYISETDTVTLKNDIAPLLPKNKMDENAKKFDLLTFTIELSLLDGETAATKSAERVQLIAQRLQEKASLPQVQARMATIKEVLSPVAWENVSLPWLEKVRTELRDLMRFLVGDSGKWFLVDIADIISDKGMAGSISLQVTYKQKVLDYLAANRHHPVLDKVYNLEQLDAHDIAELERILWQELGSREDYEAYTRGMACGANVAIFIRSLLGVDRKEAVRRFSQFLSGSELNADQQEFIATIIAYVCENGDITKEIVVNEPPFDDKLVVFNGAMINLANYVNHLHTVIIPPETA